MITAAHFRTESRERIPSIIENMNSNISSWFRRWRWLLNLILLTAGAGWPGLKAADLKVTGPTMMLPPLVVSDGDTGPRWKHVGVPGYEILSSCPDRLTNEFIQRLTRATDLLRLIIPEKFWARSDVPVVIILFAQEDMNLMSREILKDYFLHGTASNSLGVQLANGIRIIPNLELFDKDSSMVFATLDEESFDRARFLIHPGHVRGLLEQRVPSLPAWFVTGIMNLYADLYVKATDAGSPVGGGSGSSGNDFYIPPFTWVSPVETEKIKQARTKHAISRKSDLKYGSSLLFLRMQDMLTHKPASSSEEWQAWDAQATLFVRWAIDRAAKSHPDALWRFVARVSSSKQPFTEADFREDFGLDYPEVIARLNDYLTTAFDTSIHLRMKSSPPPMLELRAATPLEILRIRADWARLATAYMKPRNPDYASQFNMKRAFTHAYDRGERDPRLLAVMGLAECDAGNDAEARPLLEAAVRAEVVRPRAYYELGRIRYASVRNFDKSALSADQAESVVEPLQAGFTQFPMLRETFELAAEVWLNSDCKLGRQQLDQLDTGLKFFPEDADLMNKTAALNARHGYKDEAVVLVERGLRISSTPEQTAAFLALRTELEQHR